MVPADILGIGAGGGSDCPMLMAKRALNEPIETTEL